MAESATIDPAGVVAKKRNRKHKKPLSTSYYDPAFTYPYQHGGVHYTQFPLQPYGGTSSGTASHSAGIKGVETASGTILGIPGGSTSSGDIVFPKIDVNSIFF